MTAETTSSSGIHFDPYDHDLVVDPYPMYRRMRDEMPLYYNEEFDFHAVTRWADVSRVLSDNRTYISSKGNILELIQQGWEMPPGTVIFEDQPVHTRHRKLLSRLFTPKRMAQLEPAIRQFCVEVLDRHAGADRLDIVKDLGAQIPMKAIGLLLGIPDDEQEAVRDTVDAALRTEAGERMTQEQLLVDSDAFGHFVDERAKNPTDDVISQLLSAEYRDDDGNTHRLTRDEIVTYTTVLAGAGNETTGRLLGWAGKIWGDNPDAGRPRRPPPPQLPHPS
jgi:cytochrome P450